MVERYPEILSSGEFSEFTHGSKWLSELGLDQLTPMVAHRDQHFYINELARLDDGSYVIPIRWFKLDGELMGDVFLATRDELVCCFLLLEYNSH